MGPVIGITTRQRDVQSSAGTSPTHTLNRAYTMAVERAGGVPLLLTSQDPAAAAFLLDRIDGLMLSGGGDIVPDSYGGSRHETLYGMEPARDAFEFALVREARERALPTLAICRGMQVCNVALGGSLYEDIRSYLAEARDHFLTGEAVYQTPVTIRLDGTSRLASLLGVDRVAVNSIHHQAVRRLAEGLRPVGWSAVDGVLEAVEPAGDGWPMFGVQWHPEYLSEKADPAALRLFENLVEQASA